jgi:hypothetical protein
MYIYVCVCVCVKYVFNTALYTYVNICICTRTGSRFVPRVNGMATGLLQSLPPLQMTIRDQLHAPITVPLRVNRTPGSHSADRIFMVARASADTVTMKG